MRISRRPSRSIRDSDEALNDLFDYYLEAPGFLGGGYDKAEEIAKRIAERNPAEGQFAQARLADRRKQFEPLKNSFAGRLLGGISGPARATESEAAFDKPRLAPTRPKFLSRAQTYVEQKRNLDRAKALLNQYLKAI